MRYLILVLTIALSSCATTEFYRADKTQAQAEKDYYDCKQQATAYANNVGTPGHPFIVGTAIRECMTANGYESRKKQG